MIEPVCFSADPFYRVILPGKLFKISGVWMFISRKWQLPGTDPYIPRLKVNADEGTGCWHYSLLKTAQYTHI